MIAIADRVLGLAQVRRWVKAGRVFAVVDACDTPSVPARARDLGPDLAVSLYRGGAEEDLSAIAPYLFRLDEASFRWITEDLWATPWGILAVSDADLTTVRTHFRRFLTVESPSGEPWYFRFYDPRVLPKFLSVSTEAEVAELFGPIRAFGVTDPASYGVRILTRRAETTAPLSSPKIRVVRE
ncbi:MAG: DUF4123 domain-containing protein [Gemmatimonadales bacterium]